MMFRQLKSSLLTVLSVGLLVVLPIAATAQQRPKAVDLLPERTVVYVNIDNIKQFVTDMGETGFGQMLQDEKIAPFVTELYGEAKNAYADVQEQVGVTFEDLESLPQGEICFAIVTPRRADPAFVLMMDVNSDTGAAEKLIDRGRELAEGDGASFESSQQLGVEINSISGNDDDEQVHYVLHEGTFVAATNPNVLGDILVRWLGEPPKKDRSLAQNRKFVTIMNKCRSTEDLPMSMSFFVDPIETVRAFTRDNIGARAMLGALPILGLDGLLGVGGASVFNEQGYESVMHLHLLLANPRAGILEMVALKPGNYQPESWVPDDAVVYLTSSWDARKLMNELEKIVDTFTGEGEFQKQIQENINDELEIDFQKDVIENLEGRLTYIAWITDPPTINSQANAGGVRVRDVEKATELIESFISKVDEEGENIVKETYKDITYWTSAEEFDPNERGNRDEDETIQIEFRATRPCFGFIEDFLIVTETQDFFEHLVDTHKGEIPTLAEDQLFRETTEEMVRLLGNGMPSMTMYQRPDLSFRMWFDFVKSQNTRDLLDQNSDDNKYVRGLKRVIEENPLPDFDEVKHYFAPSGAFVVNDDTGFHLLAFQVKVDTTKKDK